MLESEAKTKECQFRFMVSVLSGMNIDNGIFCRGSACMKWENWTPPAVILDSQGEPLQDLYYDLDCADSYAKRYGKYKAVPVEGKENRYEYHYDGKIESCGDCGLKTKESGCGYPG